MLFDPFKYKSPLQFMKLSEEFQETVNKLESTGNRVVGYFFYNEDEYKIFIRVFGYLKPIVIALNNTDYKDLLAKGLFLAGKNKFWRALHVFKTCLKYNPIALSARFGIIMCYLKLDEHKKAFAWLLDTGLYVYDKFTLGFFYMYMGHIQYSLNNDICAIACYAHSLRFYDIPDAAISLNTIKSSIKEDTTLIELHPEMTLKRYDIPLFEEDPTVFA